MIELKKFETFIFDLDDTLWTYPEPLEGSIELIEKLKRENKNIYILTNFTSLDSKSLNKLLKKNGIKIDYKNLITSSQSLAEYVKMKGFRVYCIGKGLEKELKIRKVMLDKKPNCVAVGHDDKFDFKKAIKAFEILKRYSNFFCTARANLFKVKKGYLPGTGCIVSYLEFMSKKRSTLLGKPSDWMVKFVKKRIRLKNCVYIGDANEDIIMGKKLKVFTCILRSEFSKGSLKPDAWIRNLKDIKI